MAVYANLIIDQGADYFSTVTVEGSNGLPYDLTGHTVSGKIRRSYTSTTYFSFAASVLDPTAGEINMELSHTVTASMKSGRYVYDVIITETGTGDITRVLEGQVEVNPGVTV